MQIFLVLINRLKIFTIITELSAIRSNFFVHNYQFNKKWNFLINTNLEQFSRVISKKNNSIKKLPNKIKQKIVVNKTFFSIIFFFNF